MLVKKKKKPGILQSKQQFFLEFYSKASEEVIVAASFASEKESINYRWKDKSDYCDIGIEKEIIRSLQNKQQFFLEFYSSALKKVIVAAPV